MLDPTFFRACEQAAERWGVPALALGGFHGGDTWEHSLNCAIEARFRIASLTKPATASLAVRLLDLDAETGVWPPDVRVRHILSHTSGFECENGEQARFGSGDDALAAAVRELPSVRRLVGVDEAWSYSNAGYWLTGWLCAEAAGTVFEDALRKRVLEPAGMLSTGFDEPELEGTGPHASDGPYPRARRPSGGLVSNIQDLLSFARWQLSQSWTSALRVPLGKPVGGVYGLGFAGERVGGIEVWGHGGSYGGFQSSLLLVPEHDAAFVGLTNSGRGRQALRDIEDLWFERVLGERRRIAPTVTLAGEGLVSLEGVYANGEATATVAVGGDGLTVDIVEDGERIAVSARPIGLHTFEIVGGDYDRDRFDFPLPGFGRFGTRLAERVG